MSYTFLCPVCKMSYDTLDAAKDCLADCLEEELHYACPYCEEIFDSKWAARQCAAECYIKENVECFRQNTGKCTTCANAMHASTAFIPAHTGLKFRRLTRATTMNPMRHFGTRIATNFQLERMVQ